MTDESIRINEMTDESIRVDDEPMSYELRNPAACTAASHGVAMAPKGDDEDTAGKLAPYGPCAPCAPAFGTLS